MKFYLGIEKPHFSQEIFPIPFMISCRNILYRKKHIWGEDWLLDSAGFTEISLFGKYTISEEDYIELIRRQRPTLAFCQDWMCEDEILVKTGLTIPDHQRLTLESYLRLVQHSPRIAPVLQGYALDDYLEHAQMYVDAGVDMTQVFGLGSVCRRSNSKEAVDLIVGIAKEYPNIKLHGFGIKTLAFKYVEVLDNLYSADSMAWQYWGWRQPRDCEDCHYERRRCKKCVKCALLWYEKCMDVVNATRREHDSSDTILTEHPGCESACNMVRHS